MSSNLASDTETLAGLDRAKPYWWRRLTDCDPISLEPLRKLRIEPFELTADGVRAYFFDARLLASYLVSSGSFTHPISRRELTRDDCRRLDAHLRKHRLGKATVEYAFDHQEDYKKTNTEVRHGTMRGFGTSTATHSTLAWRICNSNCEEAIPISSWNGLTSIQYFIPPPPAYFSRRCAISRPRRPSCSVPSMPPATATAPAPAGAGAAAATASVRTTT